MLVPWLRIVYEGKKKYLFVYTFFCNCEKDEKTTNLVMTSSHTFPRILCTQLNIKEL